MCTDVSEFKQFGVGLELFFSFLKIGSSFFFLMSLATIPAIYSNYTGDGTSSYGNSMNALGKLSLAN
jgi:hypothetical protein